MKKMMSVLFVLIVALALVSSGEAGIRSSSCDNPGVFSGARNTPAGVSARDSDHAGSGREAICSNCVFSAPPAYTDYIDARMAPHGAATKGGPAPEVMGSWE
ncbi:MAG: hypothetical protein ABSG91_01195 [Syntrophobacteraceae bacterium]